MNHWRDFAHNCATLRLLPRILIVDDEGAIVGLLSTVFRNAGYEVTTAMSGEEALEICKNSSFDAVLSDV
jgi:CheY-like chemotaxis protein